MGGTTPSQGLRYPYVDDVISESAQANLGADVASKLTTQDSARSVVIRRPFVYVIDGGQATTDGINTAFIWGSVTTDPYGLVNLGTFPTRVTPGSANVGLWKFSLDFNFAVNGSITRMQASVALTGSTKFFRTYSSIAAAPAHYSFSGMIRVPTGTDYLELQVLHNGGGTQNVLSASAMFWQASA